jgi:hypothetical protein
LAKGHRDHEHCLPQGKRKSKGGTERATEQKPVAWLDESEAAADLKRLAAFTPIMTSKLYYRLGAPEIGDAEYDAGFRSSILASC